MAKHFEFTNNNSDVYVVGNSQLTGFKGLNKNKDCGMNISIVLFISFIISSKPKTKLNFIITEVCLIYPFDLDHLKLGFINLLECS